MRRVRNLHQQRAKLYQRFFVNFLGWEKALDIFFQANNFLRSGMKILDAGCGTGAVTKSLYRLARRQNLTGVAFYDFDLTPAMLALFQQWINDEQAREIHLRQADVLEVNELFSGDWTGFDWVVSAAMLEYIPAEHRQRALRNLKGLLNRDGHILLLLTKRTWITRWTGAKWWGTNLFDRDEIAAALEQAGFAGIQEKQMPRGWAAYMMALQAGQAML